MVIEEKLAEFLIYLENQSVEDFSRWLTGVNIFEVLGITSAEIRHSRILAWLLNPKESHKLEDKFLKKFLLKVLEFNQEVSEIKATEVLLKDFSKAEVFRESKNNIDIFYTNTELQFNIVIENKTFTDDHDNQLTKYRYYVEENYAGYRNLYIYLTPSGVPPKDASVEEQTYWKLLSYNAVSDILYDILEEANLDEKVYYILKEYNENIRRNILNDIELKELSAEIYYKYKEVLDLIIDNRPDVLSLRDKLIENLNALSNDKKIFFDEKYCSKHILRFRTAQFDDFLKNMVDDSKSEWAIGSSYFYEITYSNFQVDLYLSISSKQQTNEQAEKLNLITDKYSKYGFNTSNRFLSQNFSDENFLHNKGKLNKFLLENLQLIDEFEKDLISRWNEDKEKINV